MNDIYHILSDYIIFWVFSTDSPIGLSLLLLSPNFSALLPALPPAAIGNILLTTAPNVPPNANAYIPKNINTNNKSNMIANIISDIVNKAGDIPKKSNAILVFFY